MAQIIVSGSRAVMTIVEDVDSDGDVSLLLQCSHGAWCPRDWKNDYVTDNMSDAITWAETHADGADGTHA